MPSSAMANSFGSTKSGVVVFPKNPHRKEFYVEAVGRQKVAPQPLKQICQVYFTPSDCIGDPSCKKRLKPTALSTDPSPKFTKTIIGKKTKKSVGDKFRYCSKVSKAGRNMKQSYREMLQRFESSLQAEQSELKVCKGSLEAEVTLLNEIVKLRELELFEMEYGLDSSDDEEMSWANFAS